MSEYSTRNIPGPSFGTGIRRKLFEILSDDENDPPPMKRQKHEDLNNDTPVDYNRHIKPSNGMPTGSARFEGSSAVRATPKCPPLHKNVTAAGYPSPDQQRLPKSSVYGRDLPNAGQNVRPTAVRELSSNSATALNNGPEDMPIVLSSGDSSDDDSSDESSSDSHSSDDTSSDSDSSSDGSSSDDSSSEDSSLSNNISRGNNPKDDIKTNSPARKPISCPPLSKASQGLSSAPLQQSATPTERMPFAQDESSDEDSDTLSPDEEAIAKRGSHSLPTNLNASQIRSSPTSAASRTTNIINNRRASQQSFASRRPPVVSHTHSNQMFQGQGRRLGSQFPPARHAGPASTNLQTTASSTRRPSLFTLKDDRASNLPISRQSRIRSQSPLFVPQSPTVEPQSGQKATIANGGKASQRPTGDFSRCAGTGDTSKTSGSAIKTMPSIGSGIERSSISNRQNADKQANGAKTAASSTPPKSLQTASTATTQTRAASTQRAAPRPNNVLEATRRRKLLDEQEEREARQRIEQRRAEEKQQYLEKQKAVEEQKQAAIKAEKNAEVERQNAAKQEAALARLTNATESSAEASREIIAGTSAQQEGTEVAEDSVVPGSKQAPANAIETWQKAKEERIKKKQEIIQRRRLAEAEEQRKQQELREKQIQEKQTSALVNNEPDVFQRNNRETAVANDNHPTPAQAQNGPPSWPSLHSGVSTPPHHPTSLNSRSGQAAVSRLLETRRNRPRPSSQKLAARPLRDIPESDMQIVKWRHEGLTYPQIQKLHFEKYGSTRSTTFLQDRYNRAKGAIESAQPEELNSLLLRGVIDNSCFVQKSPTPIGEGDAPRPDSASLSPRPERLKLTARPPVREVQPVGAETVRTAASERPQFGGKTLNEETMRHYFQIAMNTDTDAETESDSSSQSSEPEYSQWVYQPIRRYVSAEDIDCGEKIDVQKWTYCGVGFDSAAKANIVASQEVAWTPEDWVIDPANLGRIDVSLNEGLSQYTRTVESQGIVQTGVFRYLWEQTTPVRLQTDIPLLPKPIWIIKLRRFVLGPAEDELFEEPDWTLESETVIDDNTAYTALEHANTRAIEAFVDETFKPQSANLDLMAVEKQRRREELHEWLIEHDDDVMFEHSKEISETKRVMVVVEEGKLAGPRN